MKEQQQKWVIVQTEEYSKWFDGLDEQAQDDIAAKVEILRGVGPTLGRPTVDSVKGSRFANMKELRAKSHKRPFRIFFAFDPQRQAILLIGGNKSGSRDKVFYETMIPIADKLYGEYLEDLKHEKP